MVLRLKQFFYEVLLYEKPCISRFPAAKGFCTSSYKLKLLSPLQNLRILTNRIDAVEPVQDCRHHDGQMHL